ncbi:hypothetical protein KFU94_21140 [Chloroflexi bacterium TSY]|nr:hypothetical protein [Chloroflexi bacterium TSY]
MNKKHLDFSQPQFTSEQQTLWQKLASFSLDDPDADFPFSARLASENDWNIEFAHRTIAEYKRFLFLACVAGHPVTPSVDVDQVWHLHLSYTRSYWDELCAQVLEQPLHHAPTAGGHAERQKFNDWYNHTLESYAQLFGTTPPDDIWPQASVRFASSGRIRQLSNRTHWVLRKPAIWCHLARLFDKPAIRAIDGAITLLAVFLFFTLRDSNHVVNNTLQRSSFGEVIIVLVILFVVGGIFNAIFGTDSGAGSDDAGGCGCGCGCGGCGG